jgi:(S)-2-hydroxyglutarate dehydrogenase
VSPDFIIVGGGVIGVSTALELRRRHPHARITIFEKERRVGEHASGRNSGILHAGFYYSSGSLKARFTREGNAALTAYCDQKKIAINKCGKLVVATDERERAELRRLYENGIANGVRLEWISADDARRIEPRVRTESDVIFSPTTASVDPRQIMAALARDAADAGIEIITARRFRRQDAGFVINAAGLYADEIAHEYGVGERYSILPFRGSYLLSNDHSIRTHIYPVPDPRFPFLGVHFTVTADGHVKIGPTALPVLWREQYGGLQNFKLGELFGTTANLARFMTDTSVIPFAWSELRKQSRNRMVALASRLATGVERKHFTTFGATGIRAQLFDRKTRRLQMDFVVEPGPRSVHVLNAVSPGFTCAFPFAAYVADLAEKA